MNRRREVGSGAPRSASQNAHTVVSLVMMMAVALTVDPSTVDAVGNARADVVLQQTNNQIVKLDPSLYAAQLMQRHTTPTPSSQSTWQQQQRSWRPSAPAAHLWAMNARTLVNRFPLYPSSSSTRRSNSATSSTRPPGRRNDDDADSSSRDNEGTSFGTDPFSFVPLTVRIQFPAPILLFENQIKNLIIEGRLSSGRGRHSNQTESEEKIDFRRTEFLDRNLPELLSSINVFDEMIIKSKYSAIDGTTTTTTTTDSDTLDTVGQKGRRTAS